MIFEFKSLKFQLFFQNYGTTPIPVQIERRDSSSPPIFSHPIPISETRQITISISETENRQILETPKRQGRRQKEEVENRYQSSFEKKPFDWKSEKIDLKK